MKLLVLLALVVLPGLAHAWWNRDLVRRRDEPGLAERMLHMQQWLTIAWAASFAGLIVAGGRASALLAGLSLLGVLAARWHLRRALFDERWSFLRYVSFTVRLYLAIIGFWIALGAAPSLVTALAEPLGWAPSAAIVAVLLTGWSLGYGKATAALLHARPLGDDRRAALEPYLTRVEALSRAIRPALYEIPNPGGHFVNAFAVPDTRAPRVIVSDTLIERFSPDEVGAVYGHETAHLEQFDRRLLLRMGLVVYTLIAVGTVLPGLLEAEARVWLQLGWPVAVLVLLLSRMRWLRRHELAADVRAVELCGDAGAVERALIKLHELTLMPRRLPAATEQNQSHPSLARRIHALRQATGEEGAAATPSPSGPLLVRDAGDGDTAALLEADGVAWLAGLAGEEAAATAAETPDPEALRRAAAAVHNLPYARLRELDLRATRGGFALVATDVDGRRHTLSVASEQQAELQRWLDTVDGRLATADGGPIPFLMSPVTRVLLIVLTVLAALIALMPPMVGAVSLAALLALIRPRPATLTALGVTGAAGGLVRLYQAPAHAMGADAVWMFAGLLMALTLPALVVGWLRGRHAPPAARSDFARPAATVFGWATIFLWTILAMLASKLQFEPHRLNTLLYWVPSAYLLPLGVLVAVLHLAKSRGRSLALGAAAIAVVLPLLGGSRTVRDLAIGDDLRPASVRLSRPETLAGETLGRRKLSIQSPQDLRLSPDGESFAVQTWLEQNRDYASYWHLGRTRDDASLNGVRALDVRFADGGTVLALSRESSALDLFTYDLEAGERRPVKTLRDLGDPRLEVGAGSRWRVSGVILRAGTWHGVVISSRLGSPAIDEKVWDLGYEPTFALEESGDQWLEWADSDPFVAAADDWGLALRSAGRQSTEWMNVLDLLNAPSKREIVGLGDQPRLLATTHLPVTCAPSGGGDDDGRALCLARDRDRGYLWAIGPPGRPPEALVTLRAGADAELLAAGDHLLILSFLRPAQRWTRGGRLVELVLPDDCGIDAMTATGLLGSLCWHDEGSELIVYRPLE